MPPGSENYSETFIVIVLYVDWDLNQFHKTRLNSRHSRQRF